MLCGSDECKNIIARWVSKDDEMHLNGSQFIVHLLELCIKDVNVVYQASAAIAAITLRQPDIAKDIVLFGAPKCFSKVLFYSWLL